VREDHQAAALLKGGLMAFDDIPEDREQSFPCEECSGEIKKSKNGDWWECDTCDWRSDGKLALWQA